MLSKRWSVIIPLVLIMLMALYIIWYREDFEAVKRIKTRYFLHQSLFTLLMLCIRGYIIRTFLFPFGIRMKAKEWFGTAVLTTLGNYFTPFGGGIAMRGIYFKKRFSFPYSDFAFTVAASYVLNLLLAGILGSISLLLILFLYGRMQWRLLAFFCVIILATCITLVLSPRIDEPRNRLTRILKKALDGWNSIKKNKCLVLKALALLLSSYVVRFFRFHYGYYMLGIDVAILPLTLMSALAGLAALFTITPANLGIQEGAIGFISSLVGIGFSKGLMVSGILRIADLVIVSALGPIFANLLLRGATADMGPICDR